MKDLILIGAGGHALSCIDVIEQTGDYRVMGLVGTPNEVGKQVLGYEVLGTDDNLPKLMSLASAAVIAVGQIKSAQRRVAIFERLKQLGFDLPVIVAKDATVSRHASLGVGTMVMHGAIVNAGARVGSNCIINSRALVEHGATVGDHCHVSTGAILNGDASLGDGSFVGSGTIVREGLTIGSNCVIGMGISLRHPVPDNTLCTGEVA